MWQGIPFFIRKLAEGNVQKIILYADGDDISIICKDAL